MMNRFDRQINLRGFGRRGQEKLGRSSVLVVGAGGLGCPAMLYLAAAGIGRIGIADGDTISISNLNRQVLYNEDDVGKSKAVTAGSLLQEKYSDIKMEIFPEFVHRENAISLLSRYDVILDSTDNFGVRYLINDVCMITDKPFIYGAIYGYEGQVSVFNVEDDRGNKVNYRDLFPHPPAPGQIPDCNATGVLGVLPGIIGSIQAAEAIKLLSGTGTSLAGNILYYNLENQDFRKIRLKPREQSHIHFSHAGILPGNEDYGFACRTDFRISWEEVRSISSTHPGTSLLIDVREPGELPGAKNLGAVSIPLSQLPEACEKFTGPDTLLIFCQTGIRSEKAATIMKRKFPDKTVYSISGGIMDPLSPIKIH